jgi:N-acyl-D-aspartate/D-glutamate deacylase
MRVSHLIGNGQRFIIRDKSAEKGYKADIAIFDPETIREHATYADSRQYSTGTEYVIVNGKIEIENGKYTGDLHGKFLLLIENN